MMLSMLPLSREGHDIQGLTVSMVLKAGRETLAHFNIPEPEANALILTAHVLGIDRWKLFVNMDRILSSEELEELDDLIQERIKRKPIQYILGEHEFWSLPFKINSGVFIPRPETELLVETVLNIVKDQGSGLGRLTILDLCTGSGILAIILAKELSNVDIYAVDISKEAVFTARENARRHGLKDVTFLQGDLFAPIKRKNPFDFIISNPPYIPTDILLELQPEIRDYEPRLALDGGTDGLAVIRKVVGHSTSYLRMGGWLILEIGDGQTLKVLEEFERSKAFGNISIVRDYCGIDRVIRAQRVS